ncbi:MAG: TldD/PmbA family protein [Burkholderiaceae bacterium]|nr:TldD/PmbA family protein [Burkholderiaceae bacterium]
MSVLRGVVQPDSVSIDAGAMVTAWIGNGVGYSATADLSPEGLQSAADRAVHWARLVDARGLFEGVALPRPSARGMLRGANPRRPLASRRELIGQLRDEAAALRSDARIVHWAASVHLSQTTQRQYFDGELVGDESFSYVVPNLEATAASGGRSQTRTLGGQYNGFCMQGGGEVIDLSGLHGGGARVGREALQLLDAPNCPNDRRSLLLAPDQMLLQIHESIGHPLELDRILGDERNFAGTSFVSLDMFGRYRYGSPLLNVSFDPTQAGEFASYGVDDEGTPAAKVKLIEDGVLQRPLGSALSVARARAAGFALAGTANARASGWHRAPIDRMANVNVEPGDSSLAQMVRDTERGVLMRTNVSWSIDDSRNKFQFGCEWGQLIENGELGAVVRNPNYRGISATFWRNLAAVGRADEREWLGTPYCGKGEPGQVVRVGHAAPPCLFHDVDVFGAEQ